MSRVPWQADFYTVPALGFEGKIGLYPDRTWSDGLDGIEQHAANAAACLLGGFKDGSRHVTLLSRTLQARQRDRAIWVLVARLVGHWLALIAVSMFAMRAVAQLEKPESSVMDGNLGLGLVMLMKCRILGRKYGSTGLRGEASQPSQPRFSAQEVHFHAPRASRLLPPQMSTSLPPEI